MKSGIFSREFGWSITMQKKPALN